MNNQFIAQMMQVLKSGNNPEQFLMSVMKEPIEFRKDGRIKIV